MGEMVDRRGFLRAGGVAGGAVVAAAVLGAPVGPVAGMVGEADAEPYGPLGDPDEFGLRLPEGFTVRSLAVAQEPVPGTDHPWHIFPDGGATFPQPDGGWVYVSNSESGPETGGTQAIRFDADGQVTDAYRILGDTVLNCAGGPSPWGTWLSCEEVETGRVWECDPLGEDEAVVRPALGTFQHEAVAFDTDNEAVYLTEDRPDSCFYRFTPEAWPSLEAGALEVAQVADDGAVTWLAVPDPTAASQTIRTQVPERTPFGGGEGIWFADGVVYFTTKVDGKVWRYHPGDQRLDTLYEPPADTPVLDGVDNIVMSSAGELFVCEDHGGDKDLVVIDTSGRVGRFLSLVTEPDSELTGVAIAPAGDRLYVSSQRGGPAKLGITFEITGPFRTGSVAPAVTTTTRAAASTTLAGALGAEQPGAGSSDGDDGGLPVPVIGAFGVALVAAAAATWRIRTRRPE